MQTKYIVNTEEGFVEYILKEEGNTTQLHYSNSSEWEEIVRGKPSMYMVDDGSFFHIHMGEGRTVKLEYFELSQLMLLMKYNPMHHFIQNLKCMVDE